MLPSCVEEVESEDGPGGLACIWIVKPAFDFSDEALCSLDTRDDDLSCRTSGGYDIYIAPHQLNEGYYFLEDSCADHFQPVLLDITADECFSLGLEESSSHIIEGAFSEMYLCDETLGYDDDNTAHYNAIIDANELSVECTKIL